MATLADLNDELTKLETARDKILTAQSYGIGDRSLVRPNLKTILDRIDLLRSAIAKFSGANVTYPRFGTRS